MSRDSDKQKQPENLTREKPSNNNKKPNEPPRNTPRQQNEIPPGMFDSSSQYESTQSRKPFGFPHESTESKMISNATEDSPNSNRFNLKKESQA